VSLKQHINSVTKYTIPNPGNQNRVENELQKLQACSLAQTTKQGTQTLVSEDS
jgi:hypothetical protein